MHICQIVLPVTVCVMLIAEACNITVGIINVRHNIATTGGHDVYPCYVTVIEKNECDICPARHMWCYTYKYMYNIPKINKTANKTVECATSSDAGKYLCYVSNGGIYIYDEPNTLSTLYFIISMPIIPMLSLVFGLVFFVLLRKCIRLQCPCCCKAFNSIDC
jgi:hypothetical protein